MDITKLGNEICELFQITSPKGGEPEIVEAAELKMGGVPLLLEQFYLTYGFRMKVKAYSTF